MSWDSYIDNLLGHCSGACDKACIVGLDGSKWTTDGHPSALKISPAEITPIASALTSINFEPLQANGITIEGNFIPHPSPLS